MYIYFVQCIGIEFTNYNTIAITNINNILNNQKNIYTNSNYTK